MYLVIGVDPLYIVYDDSVALTPYPHFIFLLVSIVTTELYFSYSQWSQATQDDDLHGGGIVWPPCYS